MHVETRLIVLHIDYQDGTHKCLVDDGNLLCKEITNDHPLSPCADLLREYLEIQPDWVNFTLVDVDFIDDVLAIYYTCMIPGKLKNVKGQWINIGEIDAEFTQKMVFTAGQKLAARLRA